jgi:hypothetical protein
MPLNRRPRRFGNENYGHVSLAAQRFFEEMEVLGDAAAVIRQTAPRDGPAHVFNERIRGAGD